MADEATEAAPAAGGVATAPSPNETFHQAMERLERAGAGAEFPDDLPAGEPEAEEGAGGADGDGGGEQGDGDKATEKSSKADGAEAEKASQAGAGEPGKPSAEFLAEADRLGLVIDDKGRVSNRERQQFRAYKAEQRKQLEAERREAAEKIEAIKADVLPQLGFASTLYKAWESKDPDAIAKAFGLQDFAAFQQELIDAQADPNYKRLRELEQRDAQRERERQEAEARAREAELQQARQRAEEKYLSDLTARMQKSENPELAALAKLPMVRDAVYKIQQEHWDGHESSLLSPERALKLGMRGAKPLRDELLGLRDVLNAAFGAPAAAATQDNEEESEEAPAPAPKPKNGKKALPPGTKTSPAPKAAPSPPKDISQMSPAEYSRYLTEKLKHAEEVED